MTDSGERGKALPGRIITMSEAAARPAPEPSRTLEEWVALHCDLQAPVLAALDRVEHAVRSAMTKQDRTELVMALRRLADLQGTMLKVDEHIAKAAVLRTFEQVRKQARQAELAAVPDPEPAPPRRRHRAPRRSSQRPLYPRSLKGMVPLGAVVAAARHSWPAHHAVLTGTITTAAAGIAVTTAVVVPHAAATFGLGSPARTPAPAASVWSAVPVTGPSQIASAVTRPEAGAGTSRTLTVLAPPSLPAYVPPDVPNPSGGQDPAPQDSPPPQDQAAGVLTVSTTALDVTGTGTGTITLSCAGGPCDWHVVAGGAVSAGVRRGTLQDGESADVALSVDAAALLAAGSGTVTVWPGDVEVQVSWSVPVVPSADPAALPASVPAVSVSVP